MDIIVGGGKYGCNAVKFLKSKQKSFVIVDIDPDCQAVKQFKLKTADSLDLDGEYFIHGDLSTVIQLIDKLKPEYIFPTAPVHIAAEMAKIRFNLTSWSEAANDILYRLPPVIVLTAGKGKIIVSFNRDGNCLEKCAMPKICPSTHITKPCTMIELMKFARPDALILTSHLLEPGLGALKGEDILEFFKWAKDKDRFVVGTACDCHGVFSALMKV